MSSLFPSNHGRPQGGGRASVDDRPPPPDESLFFFALCLVFFVTFTRCGGVFASVMRLSNLRFVFRKKITDIIPMLPVQYRDNTVTECWLCKCCHCYCIICYQKHPPACYPTCIITIYCVMLVITKYYYDVIRLN